MAGGPSVGSPRRLPRSGFVQRQLDVLIHPANTATLCSLTPDDAAPTHAAKLLHSSMVTAPSKRRLAGVRLQSLAA
jgi:hypothetical protein